MIPTSATSSSPPIASVGSMNNSPTLHGSANTNSSSSSNNGSAGLGGGVGHANNTSTFLGIASLILEGRALAEDEYAIQSSRNELRASLGGSLTESGGRQSPKPSTSRAAFGDNFVGSVGLTATSSFSIDLVNYLGRKSSNSPESTSSSFLRDYYSSSSESASSSVESNHSRWSQKLSQLRQESPNAHNHMLATRQKVSVECPRGSDAEYVALSINTDLPGTHEDRRGSDFEILRRMSINQMNFYNSPNSMGSGGGGGGVGGGSSSGSNENFMCSLQSLASNTCLRVGSSLLANTTSPPRYSNNRQICSSTPRFATPTQQHQTLDYSSGSASSSSSTSGIHSGNSWHSSSTTPLTINISNSNNSSNNKEYLLRKSSTTTERMAIPAAPQSNSGYNKTLNNSTPGQNLQYSNIFNRNSLITPSVTINSNSATTAATTTTKSSSSSPATATASRNQTNPQQGPHCDQFLKKMGLAKGDALETEEHHCDMSYVNITCTRWRAYCIKMENILARGEPICIEVYLGPVGHRILLEQWIITQKDKQPPPTMTLPSLCSAIRSQLYFSQISAWCDLIKKSDKTIYETGRVIYPTPQTAATSAAGDLATTTATTTANNALTTAPTAASATSTQQQQHHQHPTGISAAVGSTGTGGNVSSGCGVTAVGIVCGRRLPSSSPRLNIFYRIKQYDSTACFNSKPNVHNFPNVNISENCSVSVCLKSLPRITGGIPKVGTSTSPTTITQSQQQQQQQINPTIGLTATSTPPPKSAISSKSKTKATTTKTSLAATEIKATTSAAAANAAAAVVVAAATTLTTNANKPTILIMNCDNNLKEQHQQLQKQQQQQKPLTASSHWSSSSSNSFQSNGKNCQKSSIEENQSDGHGHHHHHHDVDFEYDELTVDLGAAGDSSFTQCGSGFGGGASVGDCDSSNSSFSTNNGCGNLSHREKQLLKYRKRMLKRDKKQQIRKTNEIVSAPVETANDKMPSEIEHKMEQGEDDDNVEDDDDDVGEDNDDNDNNVNVNNSDAADYSERTRSINSLSKGQRRQQLPNNHIISIPTTNHPNPSHHVKMISTGTQTITNTCTACGSEKSMICLKCNPLKAGTKNSNSNAVAGRNTLSDSLYRYDDEVMDAETSSVSSLSSSDIIHTPRNKADLLLQAIQRTPKSNKKHKHKSKDSIHIAAIKQQQQQQQHHQHLSTSSASITNSNSTHNSSHQPTTNGDNNAGSGIIINSSQINNLMGCQVCKRQKTQHHFNQTSTEDITSEDKNSSPYPSTGSAAAATNQNKSSTDNDTAADDEGDDNGDNETDGGKIPSSDCVDNVSLLFNDIGGEDVEHNGCTTKTCDNFHENEIMEEEYFDSSTKLTPHIDRCSLNNKATCYAQIVRPNASDTPRSCSTPPLDEQTKYSTSADVGNDDMMAQFKTPTPSEQYQNTLKCNKTQQQPHKHTPKPNLLHIACNFNKNYEKPMPTKLNHMNGGSGGAVTDNNTPTIHNPLLLRRSLPKVNLTPIFCNPNSMMVVSSSPIPIGNGVCNGSSNGLIPKSADINLTQTSPTFSFESPSSPAPSITVQKSNSAPTLPNSPSLSPRFVKASAIYKRRSRHLSDRSDRSSLGSDEQFSDEDIDSGMYSPFATSPVKLRTRLAAVFGRKPLLGNLEECLLQRRLVPKIEVMGFKLLLGASGGFCPTQLTIPAAAYFYELKGETLSTPYVCEIRLPRKGYTVPRCGTVQATLLNPMGTVVRMFVIPYDMRDMPSLHQTFVRQRILADSGVQSNSHIIENGVNAKLNESEHKNVLKQQQQQQQQQLQLPEKQHHSTGQQQRSPQCSNELGHFISAENMRSLRYSIHLRFQTSRTGRLMLHTDIRLLISRRTDCDTAAAHAKGVLEAPNELITNTVMPTNPKYSARQDQTSSKI